MSWKFLPATTISANHNTALYFQLICYLVSIYNKLQGNYILWLGYNIHNSWEETRLFNQYLNFVPWSSSGLLVALNHSSGWSDPNAWSFTFFELLLFLRLARKRSDAVLRLNSLLGMEPTKRPSKVKNKL